MKIEFQEQKKKSRLLNSREIVALLQGSNFFFQSLVEMVSARRPVATKTKGGFKKKNLVSFTD